MDDLVPTRTSVALVAMALFYMLLITYSAVT